MCLYRHELDDPSIKSKRDTHWESICQIFNDKTAHAYDNVDTGNAVVDSFTSCHCIPKFRCAFPVHKLFSNYNALKSAYETSLVRYYIVIMCVSHHHRHCVTASPSPLSLSLSLCVCVCVCVCSHIAIGSLADRTKGKFFTPTSNAASRCMCYCMRFS